MEEKEKLYSDLTGKKVENPDGKDLGKVEKVVTDTETGDATAVLLSLEGAQWEKDKYFAVPWRLLEIDPDARKVTCRLDPEILGKVPVTLDKSRPGLSTEDKAELDRVFGAAHWQEKYFGDKSGPTQQGGHKNPPGLKS